MIKSWGKLPCSKNSPLKIFLLGPPCSFWQLRLRNFLKKQFLKGLKIVCMNKTIFEGLRRHALKMELNHRTAYSLSAKSTRIPLFVEILRSPAPRNDETSTKDEKDDQRRELWGLLSTYITINDCMRSDLIIPNSITWKKTEIQTDATH